MDKKSLFLVLFGITIILVACKGITTFEGERCRGCAGPQIPCEEMTDPLNQSLCYYQKAINMGDLEICQKVGDQFEGINQYYQRYPQDNFVAAEREVGLKDECLISIAAKTNSEEICDLTKTPEAKNVCLSNLALTTKNEELCLKIDDKKLSEFCRAVVYPPEKRCDDWPNNLYLQNIYSGGDGQDLCYQELAWQTNDVEICQKISLPARKENCINFLTKPITETCGDNDICYFNSARSQGKISYCQYIKDVQMKQTCESP